MSASLGRLGAAGIRERATAHAALLLRHARLAIAAVALDLVLVPAAWAADKAAIDPRTDGEIRALIAALGDSGCRFQRNGRWHEAAAARDHLQRKYDYARRRGLGGSTEDFIEQAASYSNFTGRPYRIACPGQAERPAGEWLRERLGRLRADAGRR